MTGKYDVIIIGGGPAGYSAAIRASQLGLRAALVEKDAAGGTCLNRGCVPTKFLSEAVKLRKKMSRARDYGIEAEVKGHDFKALMQAKDRTVGTLVKGLAALLKGHSVEVISGEASFTGPRELSVKLKDGGVSALSAGKVIIASGSRPSSLPGLAIDHAKYIDSTDALKLDSAPESLLIIGGGAIGVEFASVMAGMGSEVTLFEKEPQLLPSADAEAALEVRKSLERKGVKVVTGSSDYSAYAEKAGKVLVAVGRRPDIESLGLDKAGVKHGPRGIEVNEYLETNVPGVYAAGDATGKNYLAYASQAEGAAAAENVAGKKAKPDTGTMPWAVFSDPPAAGVGAKESDFKPGEISIGRFPMAANSRASIELERTGWAKIIADAKTGKLLGGCLIGPGADEIIPALAVAVRNGITLDGMSRGLFFHPSVSEALHCACEDALNKCVDLPPGKKTP